MRSTFKHAGGFNRLHLSYNHDVCSSSRNTNNTNHIVATLLSLLGPTLLLCIGIGCASGMRFQQVVDAQGNVLYRSENYEVLTEDIYLVHQSRHGEPRFFKFPNSKFKANAWFTFKCQTTPSLCRGMSAIAVKGDCFLEQGDVEIGQLFQPFFDDWSNPSWGCTVERALLQEVSQGDIPTALPQLVPSVWNGEAPSGLEKDEITNQDFMNKLASMVFLSGEATIETGPDPSHVYVNKCNLQFVVQLLDPYTSTYRVVAFTHERATTEDTSK